MTTEKAVLAGGCFWGMQDMFRRLRGVVSTRAGYTGGDIANPSYGNHQGHAEAIEIVFDPAVVSYRAVLEHFFQVHDPTTYEQQGSDFGSSYRSAIFYTDEQQKEMAPRYDRRNRSLWFVARSRGDRNQPRGAVLAGGARASGLPATPAERLQLPLHPAELATAVGPCVPEFADRQAAEELIRPLTPMMSQGRGSLLC